MDSGMRLWNEDSGVTAVEYALIAGFIALAVVAGATLIGVNLGSIFTRVTGAFR